MKLFILGLMLTGSISLAGQPTVSNATSGQHILNAIVSRLPQQPMTVNGDIVVRKRRGVVLHELRFEVALDWGNDPATAQYSIMDPFGSELERFTVRHDAAAGTDFEHVTKDTASPPNKVSLHSRIQRTDMTWADLTLSFLWWPGSIVVGSDTIRGRQCFIIDVPAPTTNETVIQASASSISTPCATVKLWVDSELLMLIQAQGQDAKGNLIRELWVDSLKKIDGQWMIKDLEVQSYPLRHRTRLRIREISVAAPSRADLG